MFDFEPEKKNPTNCSIYIHVYLFLLISWNVMINGICYLCVGLFYIFVRFKNFNIYNVYQKLVYNFVCVFFQPSFFYIFTILKNFDILNIDFIVIYYTCYFKSFIYTLDIGPFLISNSLLSFWHGLWKFCFDQGIRKMENVD